MQSFADVKIKEEPPVHFLLILPNEPESQTAWSFDKEPKIEDQTEIENFKKCKYCKKIILTGSAAQKRHRSKCKLLVVEGNS